MINAKPENGRILIPSFLLDIMMPIFFFLFVIITPLIMAYANNILELSFPFFVYPGWSAIMAIIWLTAYCVLNRSRYSVTMQNATINLHGPQDCNEYFLNTIKEFNLRVTNYRYPILPKIEFRYKDNDDKIHSIYSTEWGGFLIKRWVNFCSKVNQLTEKDITFNYFFEDINGKLHHRPR